MILIDGHVHLRRCFDPQAFLTAAAVNMEQAARRLGIAEAVDRVLCLTDMPDEAGFERLRDLKPTGAGDWQSRPAEDGRSLWLTASGRHPLLVVAGRQVVTAERLEVLALGTPCPIEEGQPIADTIREVHRQEALPVLPWGFGKWIGRRGRVVKELLSDAAAPSFWLGDTANRLHHAPQPALLRRAAREKRPILPGSDPLAWPSEVTSVGRYGASYPGRLHPEQPAIELIQRLRDQPEHLQPYGQGERLGRFVVNQVISQFVKQPVPGSR
ncbi:hypothetical protein AWN76_015395 [Rhodothermaceae bacterium RA]|nr:hypothetical protein AWN76_015395 [Rhodothermaceae bacterium RA]